MAKLDARVAALEAAQSDYRALLAAGNALGANQRDHASAINELRTDVSDIKTYVAEVKTEIAEVNTELRGFRRSTEENLAELKDLIVGPRDTSRSPARSRISFGATRSGRLGGCLPRDPS
jgi:chromosome segregation ATPase